MTRDDADREAAAESDPDATPGGWSSEDAELDRLYRQALDVVDAIERDVQTPWSADGLENGGSSPDEPPAGGPEVVPLHGSHALADAREGIGDGSGRTTARQVLEAALFVGGGPLSTRALGQLLHDEFTAGFIEDALDALNRQYADEGRPYEVRLVEGGWQMLLRPAFEKVRHRVYGLGPKEVKLSQEALEVLAIVAYHQPLSSEEIVALGKSAPDGALRQLLRRELIAIERGAGGRRDVKYRTTERFLELFDLRELADLPQAEEIAFK